MTTLHLHINQLAKFISLDKGLSSEVSTKLATVIINTKDLKIIESYKLWNKGDINRIYFTLWSQNNLSAIKHLDKCFYDAKEEKFIVVRNCLGTIIKTNVDEMGCFSSFSGAKTKSAFLQLVEVAKCLKNT